MFIRVPNSNGGFFDITVGTLGQSLVSNGEDLAPSFQDPQNGSLPHGFSYTQDWEKAIVDRISGYDFGVGNFTSEFERTKAETLMAAYAHGPANFTTGSDVPWTKRI